MISMPYGTVKGEVNSHLQKQNWTLQEVMYEKTSDLLRDIIRILLPQVLSESNIPTVQIKANEIPEVTIEEILETAKKVDEDKAPGIDGVLVAANTISNWFAKAFLMYLKEGIFPEKWRQQKLGLIPKQNKPLGGPLSCRPACLSASVNFSNGKIYFQCDWYGNEDYGESNGGP